MLLPIVIAAVAVFDLFTKDENPNPAPTTWPVVRLGDPVIIHATWDGTTQNRRFSGVVQALELLAAKGEAVTKPLVVRLDGNNADLGRQILRDAGNPLVELVDTMDDAARRVAQLAAQGA